MKFKIFSEVGTGALAPAIFHIYAGAKAPVPKFYIQ
jgi:hypothetical protein